VAVHQEPGIELHPLKRYEAQVSELMDGGNGASGGHGSEPDTEIADRLVQAVVAPGSNLVGRTLGDVDFLDRYGALVVSLWRQTELPTQQMSRIRLREGDVLVLHGSEDALERIGRNESFLMLMPFHAEPLRRRRALVAAAVMLATVAAAGTGVLTLGMATLAGAVAMVLTGCVSVRQAYRAIDARMYLFIAGAIPLGTAMKSTGAADLLAGWLQGIIGGWSEVAILLAVFATVGLVVQFMGSDSATVALFGPVAIALAQALGRPPEPYIVTVAMAAVTAVLTPMSHHNLIIYGPGGYRFTDYMRVGAPLTVLIANTVALIAPRVWPG
jgi:di/tricarboxylate transporter